MKFVVFAEDWESHPSSTQHLFNIISKNHEVIWFNSVGMRTPKFNIKDLKRVYSKINLILKKENEINNEKKVIVKNPLTLPWHNSKLISIFNKRNVNKEIKILSEEPIIYWISVPTAINMIKPREKDIIIYYCGDDFSSLSGVDYNVVKNSEERIKKEANLIFVANEELRKKIDSKKAILLEHGVNIDLFSKRKDINEKIIGLNKIVGYYGSISSWLDYNLLEKIARERPNYNLVLIGKAEINIDKLKKYKNVKHIEAVSHKDLAGFSQYWQVSILPFMNNEQIKYCNPLKLKEYLAVGKPIVTTNFPQVKKYKEIVFIAEDNNDFLSKVDNAMLLSNSPQIGWEYYCKNIVKKESWKEKVDFVLNKIIGYKKEIVFK